MVPNHPHCEQIQISIVRGKWYQVRGKWYQVRGKWYQNPDEIPNRSVDSQRLTIPFNRFITGSGHRHDPGTTLYDGRLASSGSQRDGLFPTEPRTILEGCPLPTKMASDGAKWDQRGIDYLQSLDQII